MLTIEHTDSEGTLLVGSTRGDGTAEVVKVLGWRWGRSIGQWFVPRSRDHQPRRDLIERTAQALRAAGHDVDVEIDATPGDRSSREERIEARAQERAEVLQARAERQERLSTARRERAEQISGSYPLGQPILVGHHSQRRHERDAQRVQDGMRAAIEHDEQAQDLRRRAGVAAAGPGARRSQVTVGNRIETLAAQIRRDERAMAAHPVTDDESEAVTRWRVMMTERLDEARADLTYWQDYQRAATEAGAFTNYGPATVTAGDLVCVSGGWYEVARVNTKSVSIFNDGRYTSRVPWHKVTDHRRVTRPDGPDEQG